MHCSQQFSSPGQAVASKKDKHRGCSDRSAAIDITMRDELRILEVRRGVGNFTSNWKGLAQWEPDEETQYGKCYITSTMSASRL